MPVCIADDVPFEIPESWEWTCLGVISSYAETKKKIKAQDAPPDLCQLDLEDLEDIEKGGRILEYKTVCSEIFRMDMLGMWCVSLFYGMYISFRRVKRGKK